MSPPFFLVGPTSSGKSEIALQVAERCGAEILGADAFQLYDGLRLLTAQPEPAALRRVPHHLIGTVPLTEEMSAARYAEMAAPQMDEIRSRGKRVLVVGGTGLYMRALSDGLSPLPPGDRELRAKLDASSLDELNARLDAIDPSAAANIDRKNKRRVVRALEICLVTGAPVSAQRTTSRETSANGVFVFREREELYRRIDGRVKQMFAEGVIEEVRAAGAVGKTAEQTLGLREIRKLLAGEMTTPECVAAIQQATRRYAKRQLTWFRRQTNFEPLNLSGRTTAEAVEWISRKARLSFAHD